MAVITGTGEADTLTAGVEADTITGGAGGDVLTGGAGFDLYVVGSGDSVGTSALGNLVDRLDTITDWTPGDRLMFVGAQNVPFGGFRVSQADDYDEAYNTAINAFSSFNAEYVVIQVINDVFVFAPRTGQVVRLMGVLRNDVQPFNFVLGSVAGGVIEQGSPQNDSRTLGDGNDSYAAGVGADTVLGAVGTDTLAGDDGADRLFGGPDNDSVAGGDGGGYLRGDEGADTIVGGAGFDDINGNMGNDFCTGGLGTDWVVGGKDEDVLFGEGGDDIVYGNLGNDTLGGGTGNDLMRGGQGDDTVRGDDGDDILSGDRGSDQLTGGLGADLFLSFSEAGLDRVTDFNATEGDRVRLDPGTSYTLSQVGADTVVDMGGGNQVILMNVQLSTLPNGWIFVAG